MVRLEILGEPNQAGIDMLSLIKEYDLPSTFPKQVINEAKKFGEKIDSNGIPGRVDCREDIIFTIDGEDAKDLDDAVRVTKLKNGNYKLDVHIADVSNYVTEESMLDKEAQIRGTSIYMLSRVIPMLPREVLLLTSIRKICSFSSRMTCGVGRCFSNPFLTPTGPLPGPPPPCGVENVLCKLICITSNPISPGRQIPSIGLRLAPS